MKDQTEAASLTTLQKHAVNRKLIEAEIISRAWNDENFAKKLETDPAAALAELQLPLPKGKTIKIVHETPNTLTLVVPPQPKQTEEVDDEELASVSGGGITSDGECGIYNQIDIEKKHGNTFTAGLLYFCAGATAVTGLSWAWG